MRPARRILSISWRDLRVTMGCLQGWGVWGSRSSEPAGRQELRKQRLRYLFDRARPVDRTQRAGVPVVLDDPVERRQLSIQPGANDFRAIVIALIKLGAVFIANPGDPGRIERLVVRVTGRPADPAS